MSNTNETISGAQALARGAIEAGVALVTSYAGGPVTPVVDEILARTTPEAVHVEWTSNEKVALEMAFGASVGGKRALLCAKSVGLNIALDPLMTLNLSGCNAGLVLLIGDDPGAWASQNEQDSRALIMAAELPLLEPTTVPDARSAMRAAFQLSEETGLPVAVRFTRALALATAADPAAGPHPDPVEGACPDPAEGACPEPVEGACPELAEGTGTFPPPPVYERAYMRWVVLPINVVSRHHRLHRRLEAVRTQFEASPLNGVRGEGSVGVIATGAAYGKLVDLLGGTIPPALQILRLGTFHPLPKALVRRFLQSVDTVLVLEETAPLLERAVRSTAQEAGLTLPVYGRDSDHIPRAGELFGPHIAGALNDLHPGLALSMDGERGRPMPSRKPFCEGCYYVPTFDALTEVMEQYGGRDHFIVVGDPGCMVLAQSPPYKLLDVKVSLGASIGMATGVALSKTGKRVVALSGDSSFLHTGLGGLMDAARIGAPMTVLILDNSTTALTGGQPHPASGMDARGMPQRAVDLSALAYDAGADLVRVVNLDRGEDIRAQIEAGIEFDGVAVIIARGPCPRWSDEETQESSAVVAPGDMRPMETESQPAQRAGDLELQHMRQEELELVLVDLLIVKYPGIEQPDVYRFFEALDAGDIEDVERIEADIAFKSAQWKMAALDLEGDMG
jgi:indolepyruvate ferredoxin oxidoreductase alpha subunit